MSYTRRNTSSDATWARAWTADTLADLISISAITGYERPHHGDIAFVTATGLYYLWMDDGSWTQITGLNSAASQVSPIFLRQNLDADRRSIPPGIQDITKLNGYSQGTWTPVDGSGAGLTFVSASGAYAQLGKVIIIAATIVYPSTVSGATAKISGLPFTTNPGFVNQLLPTYSGGGVAVYADTLANTTSYIFAQASGAGGATNAQMSGLTTITTGYYIAA